MVQGPLTRDYKRVETPDSISIRQKHSIPSQGWSNVYFSHISGILMEGQKVYILTNWFIRLLPKEIGRKTADFRCAFESKIHNNQVKQI